jgi:hypothetical protein
MSHLLFVWTTKGYELHERDGELPAIGSQIDEDGTRLFVTKIGPSPLPGDKRPCAYTSG